MYIHDHEKKDNHDNSLVFLTTKAREFVGARFMPKYMNMLLPSISDHHDPSCHGPVTMYMHAIHYNIFVMNYQFQRYVHE